MNLDRSIMKGQESASKVVRELEVDFDVNGGIETPAIRRTQRCNHLVRSTPPMLIIPINVNNSNLEPIVATTEVTSGETNFAGGRKGGSRESRSSSPAPQLLPQLRGGSSDYRNSGPNKDNARYGNAFANNASDRRQSHLAESSIRTAACVMRC
jgi:hypothetical protein